LLFISYSQFTCAHSSETFFHTPFETACTLLIKQRSLLVNSTIVTKLQFICTKTDSIQLAKY